MSHISIDVECLSEDTCRNCELCKIEKNTTILYGDDKQFFENHFYCKYYDMCERLVKHFKKAIEEKNEQKEDKS